MMKSIDYRRLGCAILVAIGLGGGWRLSMAGEPASQKSPIAPEAEEEEAGLFGGIGLEWSTGYDTHYIFRGELLQQNTTWTELSWDLSLTETLTFNLTPWFLWDLDSDYSEFDLSASLTLEVAKFELSAGYAGYYYPRGALGGGEGIDDEHEVWFSASRELGLVSATVLGAYNIDREAFYFEAAVEVPWEINDWLTLTPGVVLGWDTDYFDVGTDLNHVGLQLAASVPLTPWCQLSPYIAGNFPVGHLDYADNDVLGGVKLVVTF
jgi:hypothetical protein